MEAEAAGPCRVKFQQKDTMHKNSAGSLSRTLIFFLLNFTMYMHRGKLKARKRATRWMLIGPERSQRTFEEFEFFLARRKFLVDHSGL